MRRRKATLLERAGIASGEEVEGHCPAENEHNRQQECAWPRQGGEECGPEHRGIEGIGQPRAGMGEPIIDDGSDDQDNRPAKEPGRSTICRFRRRPRPRPLEIEDQSLQFPRDKATG